MAAKYGTAGRWGGEVYIGGAELAVAAGTVPHISVRSSIHMPAPTCSIKIKDEGSEITRIVKPVDGTPIRLVMEDGVNGPSFTGNFVINGGVNGSFTPKGVSLTINGVLANGMAFTRSVANDAAKVSSGDMIRKLASKAGIMKFDIDPTKDIMAWLPNQMPIAQRIKSIATRGFAGPNSAMIHALTDKGTLRYKNLDTLVGQASVLTYGGFPNVEATHVHGGRVLPVLQFSCLSKQGLFNNAGAFGLAVGGESLSGEAFFGKAAQVLNTESGLAGVASALAALGGSQATAVLLKNATRLASGSGVNIGGALQKAIQGASQMGAVKILDNALDAGNVHKDYYVAEAQNFRGKAAFGNEVKILSTQASGIELLDPIQFDCMDPQTNRPLPLFTGKYIVTEKQMVITLSGGKSGYGYYEIITGATNGV